jgi:hypothetical protein
MTVKYKILKKEDNDYNIPLFLESNVDEMGVLSPFDGDMEQINQTCNFTYIQSINTIDLYLSVNTQKYSKLLEIEYQIDWGDGFSDTIIATNESLLPVISHTYLTNGIFKLVISFITPWDNQKISKIITAPQDLSQPNPLGEFTTLIVPSYLYLTEQTLYYINDLDTLEKINAIDENNPTITFRAFGKSRLSEKKLYGGNSYSPDVTNGVTVDGVSYFEYVIDDLTYRDYEDGITEIIGTIPNSFYELLPGFTEITGLNEDNFDFVVEYITDNMLTRDEHLIGFIDEPTVYSDIFVDRGRLGVSEFNLRLSEINNVGELTIYGNGFFNVKKQ